MNKKRWIGKFVQVKPMMFNGQRRDKGFRGLILDMEESSVTPGLWLTKIADKSGDWRWLYPSEFITE